MPRHEFQPGKLVGGCCLVAAGVVYAGDARGLWRIPWFLGVPLVMGGLCLAGAVAILDRAVRRRSRTRRGGPRETGRESVG